MLLDQQKNKKWTRLVAIIMVVGLVGVLPLALGLILFGGSAHGGAATALEEAEKAAREKPNDIRTLVALSSQYKAVQRNKDAEDTLDKALDVGAKNIDDLRILSAALTASPLKQSGLLKDYTKKFPKDADAWLLYGTVTGQAGDTLSARLAYQKVLALAKPGSQLARNAQAGLDSLAQLSQ